MLSIYNSLVRPLFEFKLEILCSDMVTGQLFLISRAYKGIYGIGLFSYSKRLSILRLPFENEYICRRDQIDTYKIVNGIVNDGQIIFNVSRSNYGLLSSLKSLK